MGKRVLRIVLTVTLCGLGITSIILAAKLSHEGLRIILALLSIVWTVFWFAQVFDSITDDRVLYLHNPEKPTQRGLYLVRKKEKHPKRSA